MALSIAPENSGPCAIQSSYQGDPGKKACFPVRQPDGDGFRDLGDHFRRRLVGRPSPTRPRLLTLCSGSLSIFISTFVPSSVISRPGYQRVMRSYGVPRDATGDILSEFFVANAFEFWHGKLTLPRALLRLRDDRRVGTVHLVRGVSLVGIRPMSATRR